MNDTPLSHPDYRLLEYFAIVGLSTEQPPEPLYHSDGPIDILKTEFKPALLDRFPREDHRGVSFPTGVTYFCFPSGLRIVRKGPHEVPLPTSYTFCSTSDRGIYILGTTLTLWDPFPVALLEGLSPNVSEKGQGSKKQYYAPKCLVLLSRWPFLSQFRSLLTDIYRLSLTQRPEPLERIIGHLLRAVPLPPAGLWDVEVSVGGAPVVFRRPPPNKRISAINLGPAFRILFTCLSPENIILVWTNLASERQIILVSSQLSQLTPAAVSLIALLYPFRWKGTFIPVLPQDLLEVLQSPLPYLVGLPSEVAISLEPDLGGEGYPPGVVVVDLDNNVVHIPVESPSDVMRFGSGAIHVVTPPLPPKTKAKLLRSIYNNANLFRTRDPEWKARCLPRADDAFQFSVRPQDDDDDSLDQEIVDIESDADEGEEPDSDEDEGVIVSARGRPHERRSSILQSTNAISNFFGSRSLDGPNGLLSSRDNQEELFSSVTKRNRSRTLQGEDGITSGRVADWPAVRRAFLRTFLYFFINSKWEEHLVWPSTQDPHPHTRFNQDTFLELCPKECRPFLAALCGTQMWADLCDSRTGLGGGIAGQGKRVAQLREGWAHSYDCSTSSISLSRAAEIEAGVDMTFLTENIAAKMSRSIRHSLGKPTLPFLSSTAWARAQCAKFREINVTGLPGYPYAMYSYVPFPDLLDQTRLGPYEKPLAIHTKYYGDHDAWDLSFGGKLPPLPSVPPPLMNQKKVANKVTKEPKRRFFFFGDKPARPSTGCAIVETCPSIFPEYSDILHILQDKRGGLNLHASYLTWFSVFCATLPYAMNVLTQALSQALDAKIERIREDPSMLTNSSEDNPLLKKDKAGQAVVASLKQILTTSMLDTFINGSATTALSVLEFLKRESLPIGKHLYGLLLAAMVATGNYTRANGVVQDMTSNGVQLTPEQYQSVMAVFFQYGQNHRNDRSTQFRNFMPSGPMGASSSSNNSKSLVGFRDGVTVPVDEKIGNDNWLDDGTGWIFLLGNSNEGQPNKVSESFLSDLRLTTSPSTFSGMSRNQSFKSLQQATKQSSVSGTVAPADIYVSESTKANPRISINPLHQNYDSNGNYRPSRRPSHASLPSLPTPDHSSIAPSLIHQRTKDSSNSSPGNSTGALILAHDRDQSSGRSSRAGSVAHWAHTQGAHGSNSNRQISGLESNASTGTTSGSFGLGPKRTLTRAPSLYNMTIPSTGTTPERTNNSTPSTLTPRTDARSPQHRHSIRHSTSNAAMRDAAAQRNESSMMHQLSPSSPWPVDLLLLYPDLCINPSLTICPNCSIGLSFNDIRRGWSNSPTDSTTLCPYCAPRSRADRTIPNRFMAKFSVTCSAEHWIGSGGNIGPGAILFVDFLSPLVLSKRIQTLLDTSATHPIADLANTDPTLFWNLVVHFSLFLPPLPLRFLSFLTHHSSAPIANLMNTLCHTMLITLEILHPPEEPTAIPDEAQREQTQESDSLATSTRDGNRSITTDGQKELVSDTDEAVVVAKEALAHLESEESDESYSTRRKRVAVDLDTRYSTEYNKSSQSLQTTASSSSSGPIRRTRSSQDSQSGSVTTSESRRLRRNKSPSSTASSSRPTSASTANTFSPSDSTFPLPTSSSSGSLRKSSHSSATSHPRSRFNTGSPTLAHPTGSATHTPLSFQSQFGAAEPTLEVTPISQSGSVTGDSKSGTTRFSAGRARRAREHSSTEASEKDYEKQATRDSRSSDSLAESSDLRGHDSHSASTGANMTSLREKSLRVTQSEPIVSGSQVPSSNENSREPKKPEGEQESENAVANAKSHVNLEPLRLRSMSTHSANSRGLSDSDVEEVVVVDCVSNDRLGLSYKPHSNKVLASSNVDLTPYAMLMGDTTPSSVTSVPVESLLNSTAIPQSASVSDAMNPSFQKDMVAGDSAPPSRRNSTAPTPSRRNSIVGATKWKLSSEMAEQLYRQMELNDLHTIFRSPTSLSKPSAAPYAKDLAATADGKPTDTISLPPRSPAGGTSASQQIEQPMGDKRPVANASTNHSMQSGSSLQNASATMEHFTGIADPTASMFQPPYTQAQAALEGLQNVATEASPPVERKLSFSHIKKLEARAAQVARSQLKRNAPDITASHASSTNEGLPNSTASSPSDAAIHPFRERMKMLREQRKRTATVGSTDSVFSNNSPSPATDSNVLSTWEVDNAHTIDQSTSNEVGISLLSTPEPQEQTRKAFSPGGGIAHVQPTAYSNVNTPTDSLGLELDSKTQVRDDSATAAAMASLHFPQLSPGATVAPPAWHRSPALDMNADSGTRPDINSPHAVTNLQDFLSIKPDSVFQLPMSTQKHNPTAPSTFTSSSNDAGNANAHGESSDTILISSALPVINPNSTQVTSPQGHRDGAFHSAILDAVRSLDGAVDGRALKGIDVAIEFEECRDTTEEKDEFNPFDFEEFSADVGVQTKLDDRGSNLKSVTVYSALEPTLQQPEVLLPAPPKSSDNALFDFFNANTELNDATPMTIISLDDLFSLSEPTATMEISTPSEKNPRSRLASAHNSSFSDLISGAGAVSGAGALGTPSKLQDNEKDILAALSSLPIESPQQSFNAQPVVASPVALSMSQCGTALPMPKPVETSIAPTPLNVPLVNEGHTPGRLSSPLAEISPENARDSSTLSDIGSGEFSESFANSFEHAFEESFKHPLPHEPLDSDDSGGFMQYAMQLNKSRDHVGVDDENLDGLEDSDDACSKVTLPSIASTDAGSYVSEVETRSHTPEASLFPTSSSHHHLTPIQPPTRLKPKNSMFRIQPNLDESRTTPPPLSFSSLGAQALAKARFMRTIDHGSDRSLDNSASYDMEASASTLPPILPSSPLNPISPSKSRTVVSPQQPIEALLDSLETAARPRLANTTLLGFDSTSQPTESPAISLGAEVEMFTSPAAANPVSDHAHGFGDTASTVRPKFSKSISPNGPISSEFKPSIGGKDSTPSSTSKWKHSQSGKQVLNPLLSSPPVSRTPGRVSADHTHASPSMQRHRISFTE